MVDLLFTVQKFKIISSDLKSLVLEYKKDKDDQINNLNDQLNSLKKEIDQNKNNYDEILENTTKKIEQFIKKNSNENPIQ